MLIVFVFVIFYSFFINPYIIYGKYNIFIIKNGILKTPQPDAGILEGITRNAVMKLAREAGIPVVECVLTRHDIFIADECFLTGTAAEVALISGVAC